MLNLSQSLLLISSMLEKEGKPTLAHDVESAVERIAELEKENIEWEEWFDECYTELGKVRHELDKQVRSSGDRIAELEEVLTLVKKDLLMRAEEDSDGCKVVDLSSSIWIKLKEELKEQGE